jgi:hypothetical protein
MKYWRRIWTVIAASLCLVAIFLFTSRSGETINFEIIDFVTGKRITNATVEVARTWIGLPVDRIPLLNISTRSRHIFSATHGVAKVIKVPKLDPTCRIVIGAPGYGEAFLSQQPVDETRNPEIYRIIYFGTNSLHDTPYKYVNRREPFAVALEPDVGGTGRAGVRYIVNPPAGSKDRAIQAVYDFGKRPGTYRKNPEIESAQFLNGRWEVTLKSRRIGGGSTYDVSIDGNILGFHPAE